MCKKPTVFDSTKTCSVVGFCYSQTKVPFPEVASLRPLLMSPPHFPLSFYFLLLSEVARSARDGEDDERDGDAADRHHRHGIREGVLALPLHLGQPRLLLVLARDLGPFVTGSHHLGTRAGALAQHNLDGTRRQAHGDTLARGESPARSWTTRVMFI